MQTPRPRLGVGLTSALDSLAEIHRELVNLRGAGHQGVVLLDAFLDWADRSAERLATTITTEWVERLVLTRHYWAFLTLDIGDRPPGSLHHAMQRHLAERSRHLEETIRQLNDLRRRWCDAPGPLIVPDTNVLLHHRLPFDEINWEAELDWEVTELRIVLPLVVVDELDKAKRFNQSRRVADAESEPLRSRARATLRKLDAVFANPSSPVQLPTASSGPSTWIQLGPDLTGHSSAMDADQQIVDQAAYLQDLVGQPVTLVTFDSGMRVRARASDLRVSQLEGRPDKQNSG